MPPTRMPQEWGHCSLKAAPRRAAAQVSWRNLLLCIFRHGSSHYVRPRQCACYGTAANRHGPRPPRKFRPRNGQVLQLVQRYSDGWLQGWWIRLLRRRKQRRRRYVLLDRLAAERERASRQEWTADCGNDKRFQLWHYLWRQCRLTATGHLQLVIPDSITYYQGQLHAFLWGAGGCFRRSRGMARTPHLLR